MNRQRQSSPSWLSVDTRALKLATMRTPALSSPGAFSSPVEAHDWDRCETPVSPTPYSTRPAVQLYTGASSSPAWAIKALPAEVKMDLDPDATDDERLTPMLTDADTMSEYTLEHDINPDSYSDSIDSAYDSATLAAAETLFSFARAPRLASAPVQSLVQHKSTTTPIVAILVTATSNVTPQDVPAPTTPAHHPKPLADDDDIDIGELSDLTPLKPSPLRRRSRDITRPQLKKRVSSSTELDARNHSTPGEGSQLTVTASSASEDGEDIKIDASGVDEPRSTVPAPLKRAPKRKRVSDRPSDAPPSKKRTPKTRRSGPPAIPGIDPSTVAEVVGFLVETLALSRSSSMSTTQLVAAVLAEQSHLRPQKSEEAWATVFGEVLGACEVFGRIRRAGKGGNGQQIDDQWYYQPERDANAERASLLKDLVRSKRNATKKEDVQYYWRPVPKTRAVRW